MQNNTSSIVLIGVSFSLSKRWKYHIQNDKQVKIQMKWVVWHPNVHMIATSILYSFHPKGVNMLKRW